MGYTQQPLYRMSGPQIRSGHFGWKKNLLPLPEIEPRFFGCPARNIVAVPIELSRLTT
jgi:hypothetical protein